MEFENVNNFNIALETSQKKRRSSILSVAVHHLKKWLRRAKPYCTSPQPAKTEEELENDLNELLEAKRAATSMEGDLRPFYHMTARQSPQAQVPVWQ